MADDSEMEGLELERIVGFDGSIRQGLICHPNRQHIIYTLGCNIIIEEITKSTGGFQSVLSEHTDKISCMVISRSGKFLASGQNTHMGFKAPIILWDFELKQSLQTLRLHKGKVEAVSFTADESFLISLGGQDDGTVIVWRIPCGTAICGAPAQMGLAGATLCVTTSQIYENIFVTAGHDTLRVWTLDAENRKLTPQDVQLSNLHRVIRCLEVCDRDCAPYCLCGTTTGDILIINIDTLRIVGYAPSKDLFGMGITAMVKVRGVMVACGVKNDGTAFELPIIEILVGSGDGCLGQYTIKLSQESRKSNKIKVSFSKRHGIDVWKDATGKTRTFALTSISLRGEGHQFFVGSANSQIYRFNIGNFSCDMVKTCHSKTVHDIKFPHGCNELFVTCQDEEVRIWSVKTGQELKRYVVCNMSCNCIAITQDGSTIFSGWGDGRIRALGFAKETTKTMKKGDLFQIFIILDAHNKGVSAIAITTDNRYIISGGGEGMVRMWEVNSSYDPKGRLMLRGTLLEDLKEHKASVSCIRIRQDNKECVTSSTDGTTIIWNLERRVRSQTVFANTLFRCVCYGGGGCHIITSGTDRKVVYWDTLTGAMIRDIEGSRAGAINTMDMSKDSVSFITGGEEKLIKVWNYNTGEVSHVGKGHSAPISKARISPDMSTIISVGEDGAILMWKYPKNVPQD